MFFTKSCGCPCKNSVFPSTKSPFACSNQLKIVSPIPSLKNWNDSSLFPPLFPLTTWLYTDKELQRIIKTALDSYYLALAVLAIAPKLFKMQKKLLKARAPDIY